MMPPVDITVGHGELIQYSSEYAERCMRFALNKQTVPRLLDSDSEYLVVDFFDLCQPAASYRATTFSTYDYTFYNTAAYQSQKEQFSVVDFNDVPVFLWYGYVDCYFRLMMKKFNGKVILNRLDCSGIYLSRGDVVEDIPENLRFFGDPKYNQMLYALENYIIDQYHPYVVDISKYFIPDADYNPDVTPVHYEEAYWILQSGIMQEIIGGGERRYFDILPPSIVSDLLERPVSDKDFDRIYATRALPFETSTILDYFFQLQEFDDIAKNRHFIASLYRQYERRNMSGKSCQEIIAHMLHDANLWKKTPKGSPSFINEVFQYLQKAYRLLTIGIPELYRLFLLDLEEENVLEWIFKLNLLSLIAPGYEEVHTYLLQFYQAGGDDFSLRKLSVEQSVLPKC